MISESVGQREEMRANEGDQMDAAPGILKTPEEPMTSRIFFKHSWMASARISESSIEENSSITSRIVVQRDWKMGEGCPEGGRYQRWRKTLEINVNARRRSSSRVAG